jgi:hypothetical protein
LAHLYLKLVAHLKLQHSFAATSFDAFSGVSYVASSTSHPALASSEPVVSTQGEAGVRQLCEHVESDSTDFKESMFLSNGCESKHQPSTIISLSPACWCFRCGTSFR